MASGNETIANKDESNIEDMVMNEVAPEVPAITNAR